MLLNNEFVNETYLQIACKNVLLQTFQHTSLKCQKWIFVQ